MSSFKNFVFGIFVFTVFVKGHDKIVVCYYGTWATYRSGDGQFDVSNIDTSLCTHLVYTFVGIQTDGTVVSLDPYLDLPDNYGRDNFNKFNALKQQNAKLKTILAVGGWNEGAAKYSTMVASATLRQTFITSARDLILKHGFDGLDVDWEYPNQRDSTNGAADVNNFSLLLKELRAEFDKHDLLVTVAVAAVKNSASLSYDIPTMTQYVDIVSIMAYDMYGAWDTVTGHNAPLHKGEGDENAAKGSIFSVDVALDYWLAQGCPPEKLVLGLPLYGRTFTLTNPKVNGVRAPASGAGLAGLYTATNGLIGYNEFCTLTLQQIWDVRYDSLAEVPYAVQGANWVSFDTQNSLTKKVAYAMNLGIAGAMVWSIETDDFHGRCGEAFPLLKAVNRALDGSTTESPAASSTTSSTVNPSTTVSTTKAPSTTVSTTKAPSTTVSTTKAPSTTVSTTKAPITTVSTTKAPSTTVSTTKAPSTTVSTTKAPSSSTTTTTTVKTTTTTGSTPSHAVCAEEGPIANPDDCSTFFVCVEGAGGYFEAKLFNCPKPLYWDDNYKLCNYKYLVQC